MLLLGLGIVLLLMKYLEFGAVAEWSWFCSLLSGMPILVCTQGLVWKTS